MCGGLRLTETAAGPRFLWARGKPGLTGNGTNPLAELQILAKEFCDALDLEAASVVYGSNLRWQVLATHNTPRIFCSYPTSPRTCPFKIGERLLVPDVSTRPSLRNRLARTSLNFALLNWRALARIPIPVGPKEWFAITGHSRTPRPQFPEERLHKLEAIEAKVGQICHALLPELRSFGDRPGFPLTLDELIGFVESSGHAIALRDDELTMIAGSPAIEMVLGRSVADLKGDNIGVLADGYAQAITLLFKNAADTGLTSPDMEINLVDFENGGLAFDQHASPVYVRGRVKPVFVEQYSYPGGLRDLPSPPVNAHYAVQEGGTATEDFLLESLVKHRTIRSRGGASYITLRSWASSIKSYQIKALQAIKSHGVAHFADRIAAEMADEIVQIAGFDGFSAIVPVPGGHSKPGNSLSEAIARSLSKRVKLPVIEVFDHVELNGKSHPKSNLTRPRMVARLQLSRPVILVDDVATSGQHMQECILQLRQTCKTVFAVAWISGRLRGE